VTLPRMIAASAFIQLDRAVRGAIGGRRRSG
jgi:hypothetical protein